MPVTIIPAPGGGCAPQSGAGSPIGSAVPDFIGQLYHDTVADAYYRSTGLTSSDWTAIGGAAPPVTGFSYDPPTAMISWTDVNGSFGPVDQATFFATADIASVTVVTLNDGTITAITNPAGLPALLNFSTNYNAGLTSLSFVGCTALQYLDCSSNTLTSLDVTGCTALQTLYCSTNTLTSLDVHLNTALQTLYCYSNTLTVLAINTVLSDLVMNAVTGGTVNCSNQTPAAPPSTGPPDGIAAVVALVAEVPPWSVTTD